MDNKIRLSSPETCKGQVCPASVSAFESQVQDDEDARDQC